jgi:hypothetical protein
MYAMPSFISPVLEPKRGVISGDLEPGFSVHVRFICIPNRRSPPNQA